MAGTVVERSEPFLYLDPKSIHAHQLDKADLIKNSLLRSQKARSLPKPTGSFLPQWEIIYIWTQEGSLVDVCFKGFHQINMFLRECYDCTTFCEWGARGMKDGCT